MQLFYTGLLLEILLLSIPIHKLMICLAILTAIYGFICCLSWGVFYRHFLLCFVLINTDLCWILPWYWHTSCTFLGISAINCPKILKKKVKTYALGQVYRSRIWRFPGDEMRLCPASGIVLLNNRIFGTWHPSLLKPTLYVRKKGPFLSTVANRIKYSSL